MRASQTFTVTPEVTSLAREVAGNLLKSYDINSTYVLESNEVASAQTAAYKALGRVFIPTQADSVGYGAILDVNADGKVTQTDLERAAEKYIGLWTAMYGAPKRVEQVKRSGRTEEDLRRSELRKQIGFIRKLFEKYDIDNSGYISAFEVTPLLTDTYKIMGITRTFTQDDVQSFMKMMDKDFNEKITYQEYEESIINSLMKKGITV